MNDRPDEMPDLPEADLPGMVSGNLPASAADMRRGYQRGPTSPNSMDAPMETENANGDSYVPDFGPRGGFAGRPQGWER